MQLSRCLNTSQLKHHCRCTFNSLSQRHSVIRKLVCFDDLPQHTIKFFRLRIATCFFMQHLDTAYPPTSLLTSMFTCDPIEGPL
ncbi:hypothetical protein KOEU_36210 [Komagataeibacter europaeus]|uniref:Uncharacterized protein n=1 Tax=Komagataeibacter europaeus TaxID=33995 RepID=A0A0M0ECB6_KOMEU|nr:hypothetical protein KOEU_36210 [Komagataeibacter europaeus]